MDLCVLGMGYIGLPTAVVFANAGLRVYGVDTDESKIADLEHNILSINETGLYEQFMTARRNGTLTFGVSPREASAYIIATPTPLVATTKKADLQYVQAAARSIVPYLRKGNLVILESTVPPGTTTDVLAPMLSRSGLTIGEDVFVAHSPERVLPGNIIRELVENDRVIGGINLQSAEIAAEFYGTIVKGEVSCTTATTAEFVKLIENTYRDINIAFANELAQISEKIGVNVWDAIKMANRHPRVNILSPGPGVGGHCIAVDPWFLVEVAPEAANLISKARSINAIMPEVVFERILDLLDQDTSKTIAVLGVSYKPNVSDTRESPSMQIIQKLQERGYRVKIHDPYVKAPEITDQLFEAAAGAALLLLATDHDVYTNIDPETISNVMTKNPIVFDTRNLWNKKRWEMAGVKYIKLGDAVE